jgi:hypothetical protein
LEYPVNARVDAILEGAIVDELLAFSFFLGFSGGRIGEGGFVGVGELVGGEEEWKAVIGIRSGKQRAMKSPGERAHGSQHFLKP